MSKYKIIQANISDLKNFNSFIQTQKKQGWIPVKNWLRYIGILKFEKLEDKRFYNVIYSQRSLKVNFNDSSQYSSHYNDRDFKDMLNDFEVEVLTSVGDYDILVSDKPVELFNDETVVETVIRGWIKRFVKLTLLLLTMLIVVELFTFKTETKIDFIVFNLKVTTLTLILFSLAVWLYQVISLLPFKTRKWDSLDNTPFSILSFLFLYGITVPTIIIILSTKNAINLFIYLSLILLWYLSTRLITSKKLKMKARGLYKVVLYSGSILVVWMIGIFLLPFSNQGNMEGVLSNDLFDCEVSKWISAPSDFVERHTLICHDSIDKDINVYKIKMGKNYFRKKFSSVLNVESAVLNTPIYNGEQYILISKNYIIRSDNEFTENLIEFLISDSE